MCMRSEEAPEVALASAAVARWAALTGALHVQGNNGTLFAESIVKDLPQVRSLPPCPTRILWRRS